MRTLQTTASACRHCGCYVPEGRRGGQCQQLGVPVQGAWKSCSLAIPPFAPSWENFEETENWETNILQLPMSLVREATSAYAQAERLEKFEKARYTSNDVA